MRQVKLSIKLPDYSDEKFEDLTSYELGHGVAVGNSKFYDKWILFDIASGLLIGTGKTRGEAITKFEMKMKDDEFVEKLKKARTGFLYKDRCLEMEAHAGYRK